MLHLQMEVRPAALPPAACAILMKICSLEHNATLEIKRDQRMPGPMELRGKEGLVRPLSMQECSCHAH